jgi:uncharacterized linocin/CFP29 family protein
MNNAPAAIDSGRGFFTGSSGKWAGEQFMRAATQGRPISPTELRTLDVLRNEEWKTFDNELILGSQERLFAVADLISAGLVKTIANGLSKTVLEYDKVGDMDPAIVSLDGVTRSENDRLLYERAGLPLPITHKDFYLNLRALLASRTGSEPLDTTYIRVAGRKVGEMTEEMLFDGGKIFGALPIYGYTNHPDRNTASFGTNGNWEQTAKTGENILTDVFTLVALLEADGYFGPYWLYVGGTGANLKLAGDYKAATSGTIRQRILDTGRISKIQQVDMLDDNNVVLVQPSSDVVTMVSGEPLQTVQWDVHGGFQINFKAFQIMVPLIRSDIDGNSGIAHMS